MAKTLQDLLAEKIGVRGVIFENPVTATVDLTPTIVLKNNPDRLAFLMVNLSANSIFAGWFPDVSANKGVVVPPNGGQIFVFWEEDLTLPGYEWQAVATLAGSAIFIQSVEAF